MEKYTLITGASSGLGYEISKLYAKDKNNLILIARNLDILNELKDELIKEYNIKVDVYSCDLSNINNLKEVVKNIKSKDYFISNLVNSAGFGDLHDFKDMDIDFNINLNEVNINALMYLTHTFLQDMLDINEGRIINVSSIAGFLPSPYMSTYHASKAYVLYLSEAIQEEIRKTNVKLLCLCPGPFESNFKNIAHNYKSFEKITPKSSKYIAEKAYKCSLKGKKRILIIGFNNKMLTFLPRFFSRKFVSHVAGTFMK